MRTETGIVKSLQEGAPWPVDVETTELTVTVENGVVALTGRVRCRMRQLEMDAESSRTREVADEVLEVHAPLAFKRTDVEIACDAAAALRRALPYSWECVRLVVKDARLTLEGDLQWSYQHERIEGAIQTVAGVTGITDRTRLSPQIPATQIRSRIRKELRGNAKAISNRLLTWAVRNDAQDAA